MVINTNSINNKLEVAIEGRLDTTTSPELENKLSECLDGVKELIFDFSSLEYISSSGLRVLLATQKTMNKVGTMKVINVSPSVMEVFEITGFVDILTIE